MPPPPNILLITAARWRWDVLGAAGHPNIRTPNLDALAKHGRLFPICWRAGTGAAALLNTPSSGGAEAPASLTCHLRSAGYRTRFAGAWDGEAPPDAEGFEAAVCVDGGGESPGYAAWLAAQGRPDRTGAETSPTYLPSFGAVRSNLSDAHHVTTWIGNQAVRAVQHASAPLFLWAHFNRPGLPYDPPAPWDGRYHRDQIALPAGLRLPTPEADIPYAAPFDAVPLTEARLRRALAFYYASISQVDHQIGRVLATLAARGRGNTVIVFSAAAGEAAGQHGLVSAPEAPYECNLRVPLIVAGVPSTCSTQEAPALVQGGDITATLLDIAGVNLPVAGRSLLPMLRGEQPVHRSTLTTRISSGWAVRDARFKLLASVDGVPVHAWDLEQDPGEFEAMPLDALPESARERLLAGLAEGMAHA